MPVCPECSAPITDPGLWLAQPSPDSPAIDYCGPVCGERADARTTNLSTAVSA